MQLQADLDALGLWSALWGMRFNTSKWIWMEVNLRGPYEAIRR